MRLFEIPVYAFDKDTLNLKIKAYVDKIRKSLTEPVSKELIDLAVENETKDQRVFEYNHIVGYIVISGDKTDIRFDVFSTEKRRYVWKSRRKTFIRNSMVNGLHFRHADLENDLIIQNVYKYFIAAKERFKNRFIDAECFLNIYDKLDYKTILQ